MWFKPNGTLSLPQITRCSSRPVCRIFWGEGVGRLEDGAVMSPLWSLTSQVRKWRALACHLPCFYWLLKTQDWVKEDSKQQTPDGCCHLPTDTSAGVGGRECRGRWRDMETPPHLHVLLISSFKGLWTSRASVDKPPLEETPLPTPPACQWF